MNQKTAEELRKMYPIHIPLEMAGKLLGVSPRQLSKLVVEGRKPFCLIGADIGTRQHYVRIYTDRLIAYLNGNLPST